MVEQLDHNRSGWVASNDAGTTFWRATYLGQGRFQLDGPPVREEAFGPEGVLRLWEYGVGDTARQSTSVSLRRIEPGVFELEADVALSVSLPGRTLRVWCDGTWQPLPGTGVAGGWVTARIEPRNGPWRLQAGS